MYFRIRRRVSKASNSFLLGMVDRSYWKGTWYLLMNLEREVLVLLWVED